MSSAIPICIETALDNVFGLFSPAASRHPVGAPVLLCAPWGWDEVASYRSRKRWAERLAAAGHPTLRFDLPSTGNSGGQPGDPARLDSWLLALAGSAEWLRESTETPAISAIGLGLGGLLVREAIARGAPIRELALWGTPATGKSFVRESRAFSRLQAWSSEATADTARRFGFGEGAIEAGGFMLSAETIEALRRLAPDDAAPSALRRALLLDRDGVKVDAGMREAMSAAGVDVTVGGGGGWGEMMSHPERSRLSLGVAAAVETWLDAGDGVGEAASAGRDVRSQAPPSQLDVGAGVVERPWAADLPFGRAFGILAEPVGAPLGGACAVFLNAGAVRMTGPNRMWTETSRRWAERGVRTLRVDLEGIGEADGDETRFSDVGEFYIPAYEDQVSAVLDALEAEGIASRFFLLGLCAGAYWSFRAALRGSRVSTAVLLNSGALAWHPDLPGEREARKLTRVRGWRWRWWKGLLRGEIGWTRLRRMIRLMLKASRRRLARALRSPGSRPAAADSEFDSDFDRLQSLGTRVVMAFSGDEPLHEELRADGVPERLGGWPGIELEILPGSDHTLRPIAAQVAAAELLDGILARVAPPADAGERTAAQPGTRQK
jgi:pimeloyl-ACP methyl ester carboxylesterase